MKGKLIVIEGVDASGKETHTKLLYETLKAKNCPVQKISFPDYESDSSALVKMYLSGAFGEKADDVSPYVASTFYAADRYASYKTKWQSFYEGGGVVLADRYATSNMMHQAAKITDGDEKKKFLGWLFDLEYGIYGIPKPDAVIFLDMPPAYAAQLMANRDNKITGDQKKDIHERDKAHIRHAYENACEIAKQYGWIHISCVEGDRIRSIAEIQEEVAAKVLAEIG